ncbi:MAG: RES family NAD+ phosphorylase [Candidatus Entotheonellia bacterium]
MHVYRIAKTQYIHDLTGMGARLYGGRWNHRRVSIVYTAESRALATVVYLVHVPLSLVPHDLSVAMLDIPNWITSKTMAIGNLPANWRDYPAPSALADLGMQWALARETLLLRVPSVVVEYEWNVLINPLHPDMPHVTLAQVEPYRFDARLLR